MSSRFIPPKDGVKVLTVSMNASESYCAIHRSTESKFANFLNRTDLPSITGLDASAPKLPNPRTAVPFDMTATMLDLFVYLYTNSGFSLISRHGHAT